MKTQLTKIYSIACLATGLLFTGCTKNFEELNTNPSSFSPANYNPNYLLTSAQLCYTGSRDLAYDTWRSNIMYASCVMQHFATIGGTNNYPGDKYIYEDQFTAACWGTALTGAYIEQVNPIVETMKFTEGKPQYKNLHQMSRLVRAMILQRLTDLYGDVPYVNAGMGLYSKEYFPKYDKQQDIYTDLLKEIEDATNQLDPNGEKPTGDLFYDGNIDKWKRFGNTLLLRAAMRLTKVDPEKAKTYVQKVTGKTLLSNADNTTVIHDATDDRVTANRISLTLNHADNVSNTRFAKTYIDFLKNNNDPRLGIIAQLINGDRSIANQKGLPNGYDLLGKAEDISKIPGHVAGSRLEYYSMPSSFLLKKTSPTLILTYAESELLLADAAQRWGVGGDAATHYNNGVKAAITQYGLFDAAAAVGDAAANDYLTAHPYDAAKGLEMINTQYWAATLFDGYEAWCNWRRTGYPVLTPVVYPGNNTGGTIPRRFPYPLSEAASNPVNYKAAKDGVPGGDVLTSRVWWDVNK